MVTPTPVTLMHAAICAQRPCTDRYRHFVAAMRAGGHDLDRPIPLALILDLSGLDDALWVLRCLPEPHPMPRLLASDYAEHVLPLFETARPGDARPRAAIETARRYVLGLATPDDLAAAAAAAGVAAGEAAWAPRWAVAWAAAGAAAGAARWAAAWAATAAAAGEAERDWQAARYRWYAEGRLPAAYHYWRERAQEAAD